MSNTLQTAILLKQLRKDSNMTIQDLAKMIGVSKAAISKWEAGDGIKTEYIFDLAKLFGIKFSELLNGKLDSESNGDYWRRNFDLSNYDFDEFITEDNLELLKDFYTHCKMVQEEFFKLLPKWANDNLTQDQQDEFAFLKQYFKFDSNFAIYKKYGYTNRIEFFFGDEEKLFVKNFYEEIKKLCPNDYHWEISKLYNFTYDIKSDAVHESRSLKALEYMLNFMPQVEKDALLMANLKKLVEKEDFNGLSTSKIQTTREVTIEEIERIPYYKIMLNSGCNCLFNQDSFRHLNWDEKFLNYFEGKVKKLEDINHIQCLMDEKKKYNLDKILSWWKICSHQEYLILIDNERTQYYKDIVNLKNDKPLKYYENLRKINLI